MSEIDFGEIAKEKYGDKISQLDDEQFERLEELFEEKYDKFENERLALTSAIGSFNFESSAGGSVETVYTVGVDGPTNFQGQTLFCYGVIDPADEDQTPGRIAIVAPCSELQDWEQVKEWFEDPFTALEANLSVRPAKGIRNAYIGEVASRSDVFDKKEGDKRDFEERQEFVTDHIETAQIASIGESMSVTNEGNNFAKAFGADFKIIPYATILESAVSEKAARYVFQDDSFIEARDLPPEVRGEDDELGLVGFGDSGNMALDSESIVDVFGTVTPNDDGQPVMDIFGYYGHYENEKEVNTSSATGNDSGGSSDSSATGEAIDERTI